MEEVENIEVESCNLSLWYKDVQALNSISMVIPKNKITAVIGPSGCGKSTFIRCINRMNDLIEGCHVSGKVLFGGRNIYDPAVDAVSLRKQVGMVFQKPNPFPMSIYENIAYGPRIYGAKNGAKLDKIVEESLKKAALWDEVGGMLKTSAFNLSGGQQQRLCIARTLSIKPDVLLFDEPCSALDPISTAKIEDLMRALRKDYTIVIVTHNMEQAARISDYTAFFLLGELIECGKTAKIFESPSDKRTEDYITGRFG